MEEQIEGKIQHNNPFFKVLIIIANYIVILKIVLKPISREEFKDFLLTKGFIEAMAEKVKYQLYSNIFSKSL